MPRNRITLGLNRHDARGHRLGYEQLETRALLANSPPSFDLPLAAAVAEIAGQKGPPASPFQSHNRG